MLVSCSNKVYGKASCICLIRQYLPQLSGLVPKAAKWALGVTINVASGKVGNAILGNAWCFTSVGGIFALGLDYVTDNIINNQIVI